MGPARDPSFSTEPDDPVAFTKHHDRVYTRSAAIYDTAVRRLPVWKTWIARALPYVEGPRVLEVSFGTGYLLGRYDPGLAVHGVDFNRRMLQIATRNLRSAGRSAVLVQANVERLPYADASFDSLVNTMAFSGYPDAERALAEMRRVLRPAGRLILIDIGPPADGNRLGTGLANLWKRAGDLIRDMPALFERHGFESSDDPIGAAGSLHLYVAKSRRSRSGRSVSRA